MFLAALGLTIAVQEKRSGSEPKIEAIAQTSTPADANKAAGQTALVNINTAEVQELCTLPGIGPVLARRIIDFREEYGGFSAIADIIDVSGIGYATFEKIKEYITV